MSCKCPDVGGRVGKWQPQGERPAGWTTVCRWRDTVEEEGKAIPFLEEGEDELGAGIAGAHPA